MDEEKSRPHKFFRKSISILFSIFPMIFGVSKLLKCSFYIILTVATVLYLIWFCNALKKDKEKYSIYLFIHIPIYLISVLIFSSF